jgi:hypothetical protein
MTKKNLHSVEIIAFLFISFLVCIETRESKVYELQPESIDL